MTKQNKSERTWAATARRNQIVQLKLYSLNDVKIADNLNVTAQIVRKEYKQASQKITDETSDFVKTIRDTKYQRTET